MPYNIRKEIEENNLDIDNDFTVNGQIIDNAIQVYNYFYSYFPENLNPYIKIGAECIDLIWEYTDPSILNYEFTLRIFIDHYIYSFKLKEECYFCLLEDNETPVHLLNILS